LSTSIVTRIIGFCCKSATGPIEHSNGFLTKDPERKADILQRASQNTCTVDSDRLPVMRKQTSSELSRVYFTSSFIRRVGLTKNLKANTKGSPDGILLIFFKICCDEVCHPLALLFTLSFELSSLSDIWLKVIHNSHVPSSKKVAQAIQKLSLYFSYLYTIQNNGMYDKRSACTASCLQGN
jgi:hypothetical protein